MEQLHNLSVFIFEEINQIRIVIINAEIWFVAKDVCDVLGFK